MTRGADDGPFRFDFHTHSRYSPDGRGTLDDFARVARSKGMSGFAVTDHNNLRMAAEIRSFREPDLLVVPGMEISTKVGHCLAIGVQREVPRDLGLAETVEAIRDAGGIGVPSHPFRWIHGVKDRELRRAGRALAAVETYNARDGAGASNDRAAAYARGHGLGGTGGSDAHQIFELGNAYAIFPERPETIDDVVSMIQRKRTRGEGVPTPRGKLFLQNAKNAFLFAKRGFRPI